MLEGNGDTMLEGNGDTMLEGNGDTMLEGNAIDISNLYYDAVDIKSVNFDFSTGRDEAWEEVYLPYVTCPWCNKMFPDTKHEDGDACPNCENDLARLARLTYVPIMDYYYPLPNYCHDPELDQLLLHESAAAVVLVKIMDTAIGDVYALAESSGNLDFSWNICLAYILLGYAPPFGFCALPEVAGQDNTREPFWSVLKACLESANIMKQRASCRANRLQQMIKAARAYPTRGHPDRIQARMAKGGY